MPLASLGRSAVLLAVGAFVGWVLHGYAGAPAAEPSPADAPAADTTTVQGPRPAVAPPGTERAQPPSWADSLAPPEPPAVTVSGLLIPVEGVAPAELVDTFTDARSAGRTHNAIDIMAPRGTRVRAAADGRVARVFESKRGGKTVYQVGADGRTVFYYAHLDAYAPGLADGDALRRGDLVGFVGDTGNAAPGNTHLHFAIWVARDSTWFWDGDPVNPYPLLAPQR